MSTVAPAVPAEAILEGNDEETLRVRCSVAFMLAGALELQTRLAADLDPELHKLLSAAHGQVLQVMSKDRLRLRDARRKAGAKK